MKTLQEHIDDLDRMVDCNAGKPDIRTQLAFVAREVAVLEANNRKCVEAYSQLEQSYSELKASKEKRGPRVVDPVGPPTYDSNSPD